eukprot:CAMPEP_0204070132 /NCGR_PEP_ID=MMETSP0360-20130528/157993_1 /ASSEMBLY_ACC=CAM_ASM_000342 /TAXON_ID=268821 /ORGANISM="Scrippsiella Hangoei, Strain SHTV-5" /LENGTH=32 /DNA_ID= /DNA_START= /DNA_END= /DNA_ORIENTATION=
MASVQVAAASLMFLCKTGPEHSMPPSTSNDCN